MTQATTSTVPPIESEGLDLDLTPRSLPVRLGDKRCVLREASEAAATQYRDAMLRGTQLGPEGRVERVSGIAATEPLLVSLCLFETGNNGSLTPVGLSTINVLPSRHVKKMFEWIKRNSDLDEGPSERELLGDALAMEGSPVNLQDVRQWVGSLDNNAFGPLISWLQPTTEERAKNESTGTTNTSD